MSFLRLFRTSVEVELLGADLARTLAAIADADIRVEETVSTDEFTLCLRIGERDLARLTQLAEKRGDRLRICRREGLYYTLVALAKRPVLTVGLLLIFLLSLWLPTRVLFLEVEGNLSVPDAQIIETATLCGMQFGASRAQVRSEKVKNALLAAMPQLQWVGVNTYGCRAVITVRERKENTPTRETGQIGSIVAARDGIVREMTVLNGNALCKTGQAVKSGEVLISAYTDCGICIRATQARGEIFADTRRALTAVFPTVYEQKTQITNSVTRYSLIVGKKRINLSKNSSISDSTCAKIYEQVVLTLPGGYRLPIAFCRERYDFCETETQTVQGEKRLSEYAAAYLVGQMSAGKVTATKERISEADGCAVLTGVYDCYEMIGIFRPEENYNG